MCPPRNAKTMPATAGMSAGFALSTKRGCRDLPCQVKAVSIIRVEGAAGIVLGHVDNRRLVGTRHVEPDTGGNLAPGDRPAAPVVAERAFLGAALHDAGIDERRTDHRALRRGLA